MKTSIIFALSMVAVFIGFGSCIEAWALVIPGLCVGILGLIGCGIALEMEGTL